MKIGNLKKLVSTCAVLYTAIGIADQSDQCFPQRCSWKEYCSRDTGRCESCIDECQVARRTPGIKGTCEIECQGYLNRTAAEVPTASEPAEPLSPSPSSPASSGGHGFPLEYLGLIGGILFIGGIVIVVVVVRKRPNPDNFGNVEDPKSQSSNAESVDAQQEVCNGPSQFNPTEPEGQALLWQRNNLPIVTGDIE